MKIYKNITVSKISDGGVGTAPSHTLIVTDADFKNKEYVAKLWTKEGTYGKFLSGKMQEKGQYTSKEGKVIEVKGYVIVREDELNALLGKDNETGEVVPKFTDEQKKEMTVDDIAMLDDVAF